MISGQGVLRHRSLPGRIRSTGTRNRQLTANYFFREKSCYLLNARSATKAIISNLGASSFLSSSNRPWRSLCIRRFCVGVGVQVAIKPEKLPVQALH